MSIKLRDLIRQVRSCKTAAEERGVIAKESALIRTSFKEQDNQYRHRNVAKLLFIHMLGYPCHYGQMECLKLIAANTFNEKRIGYLGLMLLLTDQEEILTLVTNSLKNDLNHTNPFIIGLSLTAIGNIASTDMARDLAVDIEKHLKSDNDYIKKKAALATIRIFKKVPDYIVDFIDTIKNLLKSKNHGVLITAIQLIIDIIRLNPESYVKYFYEFVPNLVKLLRTLLSSGYLPDYDVSGVTDPFLQVNILQLLQLLGSSNEETSNNMNDVLAQVATNTDTNKNAGNSILYECVLTIIGIESESGLKILAINILGRFLLNRDNNIRYVALNTLSKILVTDINSVQRHRNIIVECLKDPDISIRTRALELIYLLINESNITILIRELLNYLVIAPVEQKSTLCSRISDAVEKYTPSSRWHMDTIITMLSIAGNNVIINESIINSLICLIQNNVNEHLYIVHKLYWILYQDINQSVSLLNVGIWCIGEYGTELMSQPPTNEDVLEGKSSVSEQDIITLLEKILKSYIINDTTKGYILTSMIKLTSRMRSSDNIQKLVKIINSYQNNIVLELQQRSTEYGTLMDYRYVNIKAELFAKMPVINQAIINTRKAKYIKEDSDIHENKKKYTKQNSGGAPDSSKVLSPTAARPPNLTKETVPQKPASNLLDLDDIFGSSSQTASNPVQNVQQTGNLLSPLGASQQPKQQAAQPTVSAVDLLSDIFSPSLGKAPTQVPPAVPSMIPTTSNNPASADFLGLMTGNVSHQSVPVQEHSSKAILGYEKNGLKIEFELAKPDQIDLSCTVINVITTNINNVPLTDYVFQAAFPKYITLQMEPPSSNIVPMGGGKVTQIVKIKNSLHGQKPVLMRIKLLYVLNGQKIEDIGTINNFPPNY